ncbi:MAG: bifunctional 23S rRNA (guanine(2069)-N(7))-methyltransferase RlmK/23S rRNA (guanine(2445)-N(2))-methyltransferase RlmL [Planctomycetota bacterium]|nr:MAG: bifunctional 23S rRNA (guanine(2069)-N(7))-methyltransferase RlmK/23S rRNA (guanine(2445)-N(2))-methyltransferase RlmL [Planctomycetota bacterium]
MHLNLIATAAFGLESVVVHELEALGYPAKVARPGRIAFSGDPLALARANLWLRSADRVLVELASFPAADFDALFDTTRSLPWEEWIAADAAIPVRGRSHRSQLTSVPAIQRTVKKAIVDRLLSRRPGGSVPESGPPAPVEISLVADAATLDLDATGQGLHRRGYRTLAAAAQLRETLAAGLVQLSFWQPERPLVDPFCGTGTIVIEAALLGRRLAPGRNRSFAAEAWPAIPSGAWSEARREARDAALPSLPQRIIGCDADAESLKLARHHAQLAGVVDDIHFQQRRFDELSSSRQYGCVITNPPYGLRMGTDDDVERLYRSMPSVLRRLKTWSHFILSARPDFEQLVGQEADRRRKLYNGRIPCTLYQYFGPRPPRRRVHAPADDADEGATTAAEPSPFAASVEQVCEAAACGSHATAADPREGEPEATAKSRLAAKPAFGGLRTEAARQAAEFANRLKKRAHHLRRWPTKRGITCYRLYERDIPEVPLAVDRYEDALHIAEFERPHDRTPAEHADWLDHMVRTAADVLGVPRDLVFVKHRERQRGRQQYERVADRQAIRVVQEGGLRFQVNLSDYVDTGLFLDHRITRSMVRNDAQGATFLNLFAYTGAFTVYAAAGGAAETTSVDLSPMYLEWAETNLRLNGFDGPQHRLRRADARGYLATVGGKPRFDLAVVDPPTFSNSKRLNEDWDVQRDHAALLAQVLRVMRPGGVVYFSTNSRRFKLDETALAGTTYREITRQTIPEDFRNARIHRCWRIVKAAEGL